MADDSHRARRRRRLNQEGNADHVALQDLVRIGRVSNLGLERILSTIRQTPSVIEASMEQIHAAFYSRWFVTPNLHLNGQIKND